MASKRHQRRRACVHKRPYEHLWQAMAVIHRMKAQGFRGVDVYRCDNCGQFHIGRSCHVSDSCALVNLGAAAVRPVAIPQ